MRYIKKKNMLCEAAQAKVPTVRPHASSLWATRQVQFKILGVETVEAMYINLSLLDKINSSKKKKKCQASKTRV